VRGRLRLEPMEAMDVSLLTSRRRQWPCCCTASRTCVAPGCCCSASLRPRPRWLDTLRSPLMVLCFAAATLGFVVVGMQELFPLFAANKRNGLGLEPSELGEAIAPMGITLMLWPLVIPTLVKRIAPIGVFRLGAALFLIINAVLPEMRRVSEHPPSLWACLMAFSLIRSIAGTSTFIAINIILNNLLKSGHGVGFFNGLNDSFLALGKGLAPATTGAIYAATAQGHADSASGLPYPLDVHLPFYIVSLLSTVGLALSFGFRPRAHK